MQRLFGAAVANQATAAATNQSNNEEAPWLFVTGARGFATFAGIMTMLLSGLGIFLNLISPSDFVASIMLAAYGFLMVLFEAPCMCMFLDLSFLPFKIQDIKSFWVKASVYLTFSIVAFSFSSSGVNLFSEMLIFLSSAFYLVLALGKKASAEEMRAKAVNENPSSVLVNNEVMPDTSNASSTPFYKGNNSSTGKNLNFTPPPPISNPTGSMVY